MAKDQTNERARGFKLGFRSFFCFIFTNLPGFSERCFSTLVATRFPLRAAEHVDDNAAVVFAAGRACRMRRAKCTTFARDGLCRLQRMMAPAHRRLGSISTHSYYHRHKTIPEIRSPRNLSHSPHGGGLPQEIGVLRRSPPLYEKCLRERPRLSTKDHKTQHCYSQYLHVSLTASAKTCACGYWTFRAYVEPYNARRSHIPYAARSRSCCISPIFLPYICRASP